MGNQILSALLAKEVNTSFRYVLYERVVELVLDLIFVAKNSGIEQWYYIYEIPLKSESDVEDYKFYSQTECCCFVSKKLGDDGFYVRTMNDKTSIFVSWHPDHLQIQQRKLKEHAQRQSTTNCRKPTTQEQIPPDTEWPQTTTRARIQLSGGKANLQMNRQRLASFFISNAR